MSEQSINIKITKQFYDGEFSHWWIDITDIDGEFMGGATAPTFTGVWDSAWGIITGDDDDWDSEHNTWVDDDANRKGETK